MKNKSIVTLSIPVSHLTTPHLFLAHLPKKPQALSYSHIISDGQLIWSQAKRKTLLYRSLFVLFAAFFACLGFFCSKATFSSFFPLVFSSLFFIKSVMILTCAALCLYAFWIASTLNPFKDQIHSMKQSVHNRLAKYWKPFEMAAYNYALRGYHRYCYYETEEMIEKAINKTLREQLHISNAPLTRKQRFLQYAHLLERLEDQLEQIIQELKNKLINSQYAKHGNQAVSA